MLGALYKTVCQFRDDIVYKTHDIANTRNKYRIRSLILTTTTVTFSQERISSQYFHLCTKDRIQNTSHDIIFKHRTSNYYFIFI